MIEDFFAQYPKYHRLVASSQLVLAMFGMGMVTRLRDFVEIVLEPKPMITGALYQLLGIPLLTITLVFLIKMPPEIVVGFFLLAAMPGGSLSNVFTFLAKGNSALSVALTGLMTFLALFTAPLILKLFAGKYIPPEIDMPVWTMMREILVFLLLPLSVGMTIGRLLPVKRAVLLSKWTIRGSLLVLAVLVAGSLGSGQIDLDAYGLRIPILVFVYCLGIQIVALRGSLHLLKYSYRDSVALGIESSMKNVNLGLLIAASLFALEGDNAGFGGGVLFVLLLYGGISLFVSGVPAIRSFRRAKRLSPDDEAAA